MKTITAITTTEDVALGHFEQSSCQGGFISRIFDAA